MNETYQCLYCGERWGENQKCLCQKTPRQARNEALEEAARIIERHRDDHIVDWWGAGCPFIAAEIRKLKS